jgi:hypothetical protein
MLSFGECRTNEMCFAIRGTSAHDGAKRSTGYSSLMGEFGYLPRVAVRQTPFDVHEDEFLRSDVHGQPAASTTSANP